MAESDPRKLRPFGKSPEPRDYSTEEDPLVELARIVSEDRSAQPARHAKPAQTSDSIARSPHSSDLESELLQELESSFAARGTGRSPTRAPAPPQPNQPVETEHLLRSIEAQLGDVERRAQTPRASQPGHQERAPDARPVRPQQPERFNASGDSRELDAPPTPFPRIDARQRAAAAPAPQPRQDQPRQERAPRPVAEAASAPRPSAGPRQVEAADENATRLPLRRRDRPAVGDEGNAGTPRRAPPMLPAAGWNNVIGRDEASGSQSGDWDNPDDADMRGELRTTFDDSGDPRRQARNIRGLEGVEAGLVNELEPTYSDPTLEAQWDTEASGYDEHGSDEPRVAPARPLESPFADGRARSRSRKGLLTAAGVLGVLVLGGGVLALMRPGDQAPSGPPPVISAPAGDVKVQPPEQEQAAGETAGEAVYNRVAGAPPPAEEQVVEGAEEPRELSRIVLPPPEPAADEALVEAPAEAGPADASTTVAAAPGMPNQEVAIGPRRVRTYAVRPDGTITASGAAPAAPAAPPPPQPAAAATPIEPVRVATTSVRLGDAPAIAPRANATPAQVQPAAPAVATDGAAPAAPPALDEGAAATIDEADPVSAARGTAAEPVGAPAPAEPAAAPPISDAPAVVASVEPAEPDPAPAAPVAPPAAVANVAPAASDAPAAAPAGGGYVIQVSSQRSMNEAQSALAAVKQRYASIIGNLDSDVKEADLGAKGVYYRARVGRWATRAEAIEVCEALQAAGGSCFVTQ